MPNSLPNNIGTRVGNLLEAACHAPTKTEPKIITMIFNLKVRLETEVYSPKNRICVLFLFIKLPLCPHFFLFYFQCLPANANATVNVNANVTGKADETPLSSSVSYFRVSYTFVTFNKTKLHQISLSLSLSPLYFFFWLIHLTHFSLS